MKQRKQKKHEKQEKQRENRGKTGGKSGKKKKEKTNEINYAERPCTYLQLPQSFSIEPHKKEKWTFYPKIHMHTFSKEREMPAIIPPTLLNPQQTNEPINDVLCLTASKPFTRPIFPASCLVMVSHGRPAYGPCSVAIMLRASSARLLSVEKLSTDEKNISCSMHTAFFLSNINSSRRGGPTEAVGDSRTIPQLEASALARGHGGQRRLTGASGCYRTGLSPLLVHKKGLINNFKLSSFVSLVFCRYRLPS